METPITSKMRQRWYAMIKRCTNPKDPNYHRYGGRGITVCKEWLESYAAFASDMGPPPGPYHTLDRINNGEGYSPTNCRWATYQEQARNRRDTKLTPDQVADIVYLVAAGDARPEDIAAVYGISKTHARSVALGKHFRVEGLAYPIKLPRFRPAVYGDCTKKLTPEQVLDLRRRYRNGEKPQKISVDYGVSPSCAYAAATGRTWRNL